MPALKFAVLAGDYIGPEVMQEALRVLAQAPGVDDRGAILSAAAKIEQALDADPILAFGMNGEALPWLNGFPLRLVVPGHYGTYWVKHLNAITVLDKPFEGFWMKTAYRIPDNACGCRCAKANAA